MIQLNPGKYSALAFVKDELSNTLSLALDAMNDFIDDPENASVLSTCIEAIYQVKGTLEMLNLSGAGMLVEELQQAVAAIRNNRIQDKQAIQEAIIRALLLLPGYLKMLGEDFHDHPLTLLENINELRRLRNQPEQLPENLFSVDFNIPLPEDIAPNPLRKLPELNINPQQLSHIYQLHLLNWLKTHSAENLQKMHNITHYLRLSSHEDQTTRLWWIAEIVLDALLQDDLEATASVKSLLGKLNNIIKIQSSQGEKNVTLDFPYDLLKQLLLTIARANSQKSDVLLLKQTFELHFFDQRQKLSTMADSARSDAYQALLEQIQTTKEQVGEYNNNRSDSAILQQITEQLRSMSDSLALLEEYEASNLMHHQFETVDALIANQQQSDEPTLTELADTLVKVESLIQASSPSTKDKLRQTVIDECLLEMANIKENLSLASQNRKQHAREFVDIASRLKLISGSMNMLDYPEAAQVLIDTSTKISNYADNDLSFNTGQFNRLAEILASCDLFMEGVRQHGQALNVLLRDASNKQLDFDTIKDEETDGFLPRLENKEITDQSEIDEKEKLFATGIDDEISDIFIEEANEVLKELEQLLPGWLQQQDNDRLMDIRRHFHTLKGSGRMAGANAISKLAWSVERVLNHVLQGTRPGSEQVKQLVSNAYEHIPILIDRFARTKDEPDSDDTVVASLIALSQQCLAEPDNTITDEIAPLSVDQTELIIIEPEPSPAGEESTAEQPQIIDIPVEISDQQAATSAVSTDKGVDEETPGSMQTITTDEKPDAEEQQTDTRQAIATAELNQTPETVQPFTPVDDHYNQAYQQTAEHSTDSSKQPSPAGEESTAEQPQIIDIPAEISDQQAAASAVSTDNGVDEDTPGSMQTITTDEKPDAEEQQTDTRQAIATAELNQTPETVQPFTPVDDHYNQAYQQTAEHSTDSSKQPSPAGEESTAEQPQIIDIPAEISDQQAAASAVSTDNGVDEETFGSMQTITTDEKPDAEEQQTDTRQAIASTELNQTPETVQPFTPVDDHYNQAYQQTAEHSTDSSKQPLEPARDEAQELLQIFKDEATEQIAALRRELETIDQSRHISKPALRSIHSLKGCSNVAGIKPMADIATEINTVFDRLYRHDVALSASAINVISRLTDELELLLFSLDGISDEPDTAHIGSLLDQLAPEIDDNAVPLIDPEILLTYLQETDELLKQYADALSDWFNDPDDEHSSRTVQQSLATLEQEARQQQQNSLASIYSALSELVNRGRPITDELKQLFETGYGQLRQQIDILSQNKPINETSSYPEQVHDFLNQPPAEIFSADTAQADKSEEEPTISDIDETEFVIPPDSDPDILQTFSEEVAELLLSTHQAIKNWQSSTDTEQSIAQLQRDLHTLKGSARLSGITPMADLSHQMETLVNSVVEQKNPADENFYNLFLRCQDKLSEMHEQLAARKPVTTAASLIKEISLVTKTETAKPVDLPAETSAILQETPALATDQPKASTAPLAEQVRIKTELLDNLTNYASEISISRDRVVQQHIAMQSHMKEMEFTISKLRDQLRNLEIETETQILFRYEDERLKKNHEFDPLELDRFSTIQQLSRGLSESVTDLLDISESMSTLGKETDILLMHQTRLNSDLQHNLMYTRLLPFSTISSRLERIVRQTSADLDKKAELSINGAELEIDRAILDKLVAPVEHILRNAIAHGIEPGEQREAVGKPAIGTLQMDIVREGTEMRLTIRDDGQGINIEKVKQKALDLGLIDTHDIPGNDKLIQLILTTGFSTADNVSQIAGRGVGLDVVSNEIRSLKGRLSIQSRQGEGTTFTILLPLTLSVMQALLITVQNEQYAMPLGTVNAGERIAVSEVKSLLGSDQPKYQFNGDMYDFIPLATLLDKPLRLPEQENIQLPLLLFHSGEQRMAFLIDAVNGNREIVIKPVGKQLSHIQVINSATILGDGRIVFVLDIPALLALTDNKPYIEDDSMALEHDLQHIQQRPLFAMVVDDSITVRKTCSNLLTRLGFKVMTAKDGLDALTQIHTQMPDIVLLDIEMPRMDGFEFASMIRNDVDFHHLPIIMITSRTGEKHRQRAQDIGVNAYLGKPFREDQLIETMQQLLGDRFSPGNE